MSRMWFYRGVPARLAILMYSSCDNKLYHPIHFQQKPWSLGSVAHPLSNEVQKSKLNGKAKPKPHNKSRLKHCVDAGCMWAFVKLS